MDEAYAKPLGMTLKDPERKVKELHLYPRAEGVLSQVFAVTGPTPQMAARSDIPLRAPQTAALDPGGVGVPRSLPRSPPESGERA